MGEGEKRGFKKKVRGLGDFSDEVGVEGRKGYKVRVDGE